MTNFCPSTTMLKDFVCGHLTNGKDLIIKSHLTFCPKCRNEVRKLECIAGSLLKNNMNNDCKIQPSIKKTLSKISNERIKDNDEKPEDQVTGGILPQVINNFIGKSSSDINWRFRLPGIYDYQIDSSNEENIYLLKVDPGARILQHTHEGEESTIILKGQMKDGDKTLSLGDISILNNNHTHNPQVSGTETCLCLVVMSGKVKFTGRFSRALNIFN